MLRSWLLCIFVSVSCRGRRVDASRAFVTFPRHACQAFGYNRVRYDVDLFSSPVMHLLTVVTARSQLDCAVLCHKDYTCRAIQYGKSLKRCGLFEGSTDWLVPSAKRHDPVLLLGPSLATQDDIKKDCSNQIQDNYYKCPLYSTRCQPHKRGNLGGCANLLEQGNNQSGIYTVSILAGLYNVYCDQSRDGGGWTVIQRRVDASVNFYGSWENFVAGFGHLESNLWLGLEKMHLLTRDETELHIYLETFEGESAYAHYSHFAVEDATTGYRLTVSNFSGTAGDSLTYHSGQPFSAYAKDHDKSTENCTVFCYCAWWYSKCFKANLNGVYYEGRNPCGITWKTFKGHAYSYKTVVMKLRPAT